MKITTIDNEVRDIRPGQDICGTRIKKIEITYDDIWFKGSDEVRERLKDWMFDIIFVRLIKSKD